VNATFRCWLRTRQSRIRRRLDKTHDTATYRPVLSGRPIDYDVSHRHRAIAHGGIGAIHMLAQHLGLPRAIDERLHLLKVHLPYHESDHVLNIAYNPLCHGTCLQDIEPRRNDDAFLDALGTRRTPDPTTAGDFCRRFTQSHIDALQDAIDAARRNVWAEQPVSSFDRATLDMDGTLVPTTGSCKAGMGIAYDGTWGYHPLVVGSAETGEVLRLLNRSGNRPSHEGAAGRVDQAIWLCLRARFRRVVLRGDTDFSQAQHLDRRHALPSVYFVFGYDARPNLTERAEGLPNTAWQPLHRPPRYEVQAQPRQRPGAVKDRIVRERGFEVPRLTSEAVAEFAYQPSARANSYRMVVVRPTRETPRRVNTTPLEARTALGFQAFTG
jgi:hypothetical protein